MGKNNWMSFCDENSAPTIAAVDLIFVPVVFKHYYDMNFTKFDDIEKKIELNFAHAHY